jgi:maltose phosphorylase
MRTDGETLAFAPSIPRQWKAFRFKVSYAGSLLSVEVGGGTARFRVLEGGEVSVDIYGAARRITGEGLEIELPRGT